MPPIANPRRTRLPLPAPSPGAPARVLLDLSALAREVQERRRAESSD